MDRKMDVLATLKVRGSASLEEIARQLGMSKQGAARHLEALRARGLVEATRAEPHGPGRPVHVYRLTEAAGEQFPSGHRELASELVDFMETGELERFFTERARRMEAQYRARVEGVDLETRTRELARVARENGHMTEVAEGPGGSLRLRHCNCPIQEVAARTGHPCQHELDVYRKVLRAEVVRSSWVGAGDTSCSYDIRTDEH
jgi:predicted ArsR family transcriptional regulator